MYDNFDYLYKKFISSSEWKKMRLVFIEGNYNIDSDRACENPLFCYRCDCCGWNWPKEEMEVHHKHYHRPFGQETREDVLVVCKYCHPKMDKMRAQQGREENQAALNFAIYTSGFETWIAKRYGKDAIECYWDDELEHQRFQDFLDRNQE